MPTRRELQIHNEVFFAEILSRVAEGKRPRLRPRGSSMRPFIRGGQDQIVLSPLTEDSYQVGRVSWRASPVDIWCTASCVSMEVSSPCVATAIPTSVSSVPRRRSWPK